MKKVLWFSRHEMSPEQAADLERLYGPVDITTVDITASCAQQVVDLADEHGSDVVAAVLPVDLAGEVASLLGDRPLLAAKSERVRSDAALNPDTGKRESVFVFKHVCWYRIPGYRVEIL